MASQAGRWTEWAEGTAAAWRGWEKGAGTSAPAPAPAPSPSQPWATPTTARSLQQRLAAMGAVPALGGGVPLPAPACLRDTDRSKLVAGLEAPRGASAWAAPSASEEGEPGGVRAVSALLRKAEEASSDGGPAAAETAAGGGEAKAGGPGGCVVVAALATAAPPSEASVVAMAAAFSRGAGLGGGD